MILPGDATQSIAEAAATIRAGSLLGLPTETVYGLAADCENDAAVAAIFAAKGRPQDHPLIVHVLDTASVSHFAAHIPGFAQALMDAFWPGPLTLILPRRAGIATAAAGGQDSIGLRSPAHPVARAVLAACLATRPGTVKIVRGLAAPSANQFGRVSPTTAAHVQGEFGPELMILDGGACAVGIESTIIDCTRGVPVLLRPGAITPQQASAACGLKVLQKEELLSLKTQGPKASGTLESHYAPRATVRLMDAPTLQAELAAAAAAGAPSLATTLVAVYARCALQSHSPKAVVKPMPQDPGTAAHELFADLRALDELGVQAIWVEAVPEGEAWDGVRDRLQRAAAG